MGKGQKFLLTTTICTVFTALVGFTAPTVEADVEAAKKWIDTEFQPSTLSKEEQLEEMKWFIEAAKPLKGVEIKVLTDGLPVATYEAEVLRKAFMELTGIKVNHDLLGEKDVVEKIQTQMQTDRHIYDMYVNDSDLIGTHYRYGKIEPLSDFMKGDGKDFTLPTLDLDDFIGISFVTAPDGKMYQLPDQQFANLYWFRYDWFNRADLKEQFKAKYGYELGVPVNWSAYEDIANFFTNDVKELDGKAVYGHMDYGKKGPSLGWRFTDAWLSMAGVGDKGIPNGLPVDEWGIRVEDSIPVGASVERGGAANSPAAVYSLQKFVDWLKLAPPEAYGLDFWQAGPVPAQGQIAQQIFWYTAFTESALAEGLPVVNEDGTPKWRMAPSPHGPYWEEGMKLGYQDVGAWTMFSHIELEKKQAAWLYAQFMCSKTVSLQKFLKSLTPIRESDLNHPAVTERAPKLGGLIEFYRSPARLAWTPTGTNVPDYPKLAQLWWQSVSLAITGEKTSQEAMDNLAYSMDKVLGRLERMGLENSSPKLNEKKDKSYWLNKPGSPKAKLENEKPQGVTVNYDELVETWKKAQ
ncbi:MAG: ABC transporter substrate-binding protein [Desulforhopalus sp.]